MTTKDFVVLFFWVLAVVLLLLGGFDVDIHHPSWNLFGLAAASFLVGYIIRAFVVPQQS